MPDPHHASDHLVGLDAILAARETVAGRVHRTPMLSSQTAARILQVAGGPAVADATIYVKAENLQVTGSFKPRGMTNKVASLTAAERDRGIVTLSAVMPPRRTPGPVATRASTRRS
jgi:threonine dehydratase